MKTLERKIYFYRANLGTDENGLALPFDPRPALTIVNKLQFTGTKGRYLTDSDGDAFCGWIDDQKTQPRMRFGRIRRAGLPQIEQSGELSDLNIAADAGLVEPIHIVFFPDNIVGMEFNFYGPRLSRFGYYLHVKSEQIPLCTFEPLLRNDVVSQLNHLTDVRLLDLKIRPSYVDRIRQADNDLGSAFDAARRVGDTELIEIVIRPTKVGRSSIVGRIMQTAKSLAGHSDLRTEASKFIIKGKRDDSGKVETIDLLHDQLIVKKQIVRLSARSRALDKNSAYAAIVTAYGELEEELKAASSVLS